MLSFLLLFPNINCSKCPNCKFSAAKNSSMSSLSSPVPIEIKAIYKFYMSYKIHCFRKLNF